MKTKKEIKAKLIEKKKEIIAKVKGEALEQTMQLPFLVGELNALEWVLEND